jgi:hypothetical protein
MVLKMWSSRDSRASLSWKEPKKERRAEDVADVAAR